MKSVLGKSNGATEDWISVSDLMAGLMLVFLAIAIFFMLRIHGIATQYRDLQSELYDDLEAEFRDDLPRWNAVLTRDLAVRFTEPDILFDQGESDLKPEFEGILDDFFPRYVAVLTRDEYKDHIDELRIEGHTSSEWRQSVPEVEAYFNNMRLSQDRTRRVLQYVYLLPEVIPSAAWLKARLTANGLSSSQLVTDELGAEDPETSRRVEFRVRTDAESQLRQIAEQMNPVARGSAPRQ